MHLASARFVPDQASTMAGNRSSRRAWASLLCPAFEAQKLIADERCRPVTLHAASMSSIIIFQSSPVNHVVGAIICPAWRRFDLFGASAHGDGSEAKLLMKWALRRNLMYLNRESHHRSYLALRRLDMAAWYAILGAASHIGGNIIIIRPWWQR